MSKEKIRITAFVPDELANEFTEITRRIGVSGTALLNMGLPAELDYLSELPAYSEKAAATWRAYAALVDTVGTPSRRFNITLDRQDAERLDQLCLEKRVPRNVFIGCYLDFLVSGAEGVCEAPLKKVSEILMNPRHEYEETRRSAPAIDEEFYNPASGESKTIKAVPQGNPYSSLLMVRHAYKFLDLEHLDLWNRLKERETGAPENR